MSGLRPGDHVLQQYGTNATAAVEPQAWLALSDPPRPEAACCVSQLQSMGVRVVMVTGDAPTTAAAVSAATVAKLWAGRGGLADCAAGA